MRLRPRVIILVVLAALLAVSAPAWPFLSRFGALPRTSEQPVNVLLAGVTPNYQENAPVWPWPAKPEDYTGITDTILLVQLRPDGTANVLSIPRDTWLNVPGWGYGKINGANPHGGPDMLMNAVQSLTGIKPDAYVFLSLYAVRSLADAAGGVTLDVPQVMKYDDNAGKLHIDLQPGRQRLSGVQAEGFLRFRKDGLGDIGRVERQQLFLTALMHQVKNPLNAWRIPLMVSAVDRNMKTDLDRATVSRVLGVALRGPQVSMNRVPGDFGGGGTWVVDHAALRALMREKFSDPNDPRGLSVAVVNVDAPDGSARRMKTHLEGLGYQDVQIVNEPRSPASTTVSGNLAARVLRDVGHGQVAQAGSAGGADVTVRLGSDTPAN